MGLRVIDGGKAPQIGVAEYVWVDAIGDFHTKTRVIPVFEGEGGLVPQIEAWSASWRGERERILLSPCHYTVNPYMEQPSFIVLCEVRDPQDNPHKINTRHLLRKLIHREGGRSFSEWGFKQEFQGSLAINSDKEWKAVQDHLLRCIDAGLMVHSARTCDEEALWNFKIGRRGDLDGPRGQDYPLLVCDHLLTTRFLLERASQENGAALELAGEGVVYFSTAEMREDESVLHAAASVLSSVTPLRGWKPEICIREGYLEARGLKPAFDPYTATAFLLGTLLEAQ